MGSRSCVIDGELVAFDENGRPSFGRLQQRLHLGSRTEVLRRSHEVPASFLAFDILYLEGKLLYELSYDERRSLLDGIGLAGDTFATPPSFTGKGREGVVETSVARSLEGIVAKRRSSKYKPGSRNGDWVKVKNFRTQEVVLGGWTEGRGERSGSLGALLLGIPHKVESGERTRLRGQGRHRIHRRGEEQAACRPGAARLGLEPLRRAALEVGGSDCSFRQTRARGRGPGVCGMDL